MPIRLGMLDVLNDPVIFCISIDIFLPSETVLSALSLAVVDLVGEVNNLWATAALELTERRCTPPLDEVLLSWV